MNRLFSDVESWPAFKPPYFVGKDSANERKQPSLLELFAECSLSYGKIVQMSARQKKTPQDLLLLCRMQPILSKDSARREKNEKQS